MSNVITYDELTVMYNELLLENSTLREEIKRLKNRGAGRKTKYNDDFQREVIRLYLDGHTMRTISVELGCSIGTVSKILKANG